MLKQMHVDLAALTAPEKTPLPTLTESSKPASLSPMALMIAKAVDRLLSFYSPPDVADPESFIAGIGAILALYPPELIAVAVDPTGIPRRIKVLRNLADVDEVCRDLYGPIAMRMTREALARAPRALPRPPRTAAEQSRIDAQVGAAMARLGVRVDKVWHEPIARGDGKHHQRVAEQLAARRARRESEAA